MHVLDVRGCQCAQYLEAGHEVGAAKHELGDVHELSDAELVESLQRKQEKRKQLEQEYLRQRKRR